MAENIATREAYGKALVEFGEKYDIIVLDADLSKSTHTASFAKKYPERFINCGIAEANMAVVAAGIASTGKIVFYSSFAMFAAGRAFEQVRNSICYPQMNVKIGATHAGISVGEDGASHQTVEDISIMRSIPGMVVISPCDGVETRAAVEAAIKYDGPVYLRLGRLSVPVIFDETVYKFEMGKGMILREGKDVTIIATGLMVAEAIKAGEILAEEGIDAEIINIHTIKPIDRDIIIRSAKKTGIIVTAEEHSVIGGLGSAVAEVVTDEYPVAVLKVGIKDIFGRSGKPAALLEMYGLLANDIVLKAREAIKRKG